MCLSNIYAENEGERQLLFANAATVKQEGNELVCANILGIPNRIKGTIRYVDLMENIIIVDQKPEG